jgi:DNA-binding transcriptional ArsR family regulator
MPLFLFTNMGERKHAEPELDDIFLALSHPTRRRMLELLQGRSHRVTELAESFELSLNVVSKHLKYLERAGLLQRAQEGRVHNLHADTEALQPAVDWLSQHLRMWTGALSSLERFIVKTNRDKKPKSKRA